MTGHNKDLTLELLNKLKHADRKIRYYEQLLQQNGISYALPDEITICDTAEQLKQESKTMDTGMTVVKELSESSVPVSPQPHRVTDHKPTTAEHMDQVSKTMDTGMTAVKELSGSSVPVSPQPRRVMDYEPITSEHIALFRSVFRGRDEFYAKRTTNGRYVRPCLNWDNRSGICPKQTEKFFPCKNCRNQNFRRLEDWAIAGHLNGKREDGSDVIGIYPITSRNTCWFIVFDFDDKNHAKIYENASHNEILTGKDLSIWSEINSLSEICKTFDVPHLLERSRSGYGAHLWIFFDQEIDCAVARKFGNSLLSQGMKSVNMPDFRTYDRMLPMQDYLEENQAGNLIALPLQGMACRSGNSMFVNRKQQVFPNQWNVLRNLKRLPKEKVLQYLNEWKLDDPYGEISSLYDTEDDPTRPWDIDRDDFHPQDVKKPVEIVLANGVYVNKEQMAVRMQNRIRRLALYRNPEYFKAKRRNNEVSNLKFPYFVYCGKDIEQYINLPRGCTDALLTSLKDAGINISLMDKRSKGRSLDVSFKGVLKDNQISAVSSLRDSPYGIISAATAFGKTVVGAALIAERKVSTLILVNRGEIMEGWYETLSDFLDINEPLPEYSTPTGIIKKRASCIGRLGGSKKELNGIIDVAMIQSLVSHGEVKTEVSKMLKQYGMIIVDECHHVAGYEYQEVLNTVTAQYVYGFTATPKRYDSQDKKMYFQLGKIRYRFTAKDRLKEQNIDHLVNPRFTRSMGPDPQSNDYNKMLSLLMEDGERNQLIVKDVLKCVEENRTPLILTKRVDHAKKLYEMLEGKADHVFNMAGKQKAKELRAMMEERRNVPDNESVILISTGSKAGEGFNYPRLDTLMLAAPVSWEGSIEQYAGRLNRDYPTKKNVIIFDYVDSGIPMFDRMYRKRLSAYRQIGFELCTTPFEGEIVKNTIYSGITFRESFMQDIRSAKQSAVIFSPYLSHKVLNDFIAQTEEVLHRGTVIHIITLASEKMDPEYADLQKQKIVLLKRNGFIVSTTSNTKFDCNYAIIDQSVVWYGNMNILAKSDEDNDIIRFVDASAAASLLQNAMRFAGIKLKTHALRTRLDI